MKEDYFSDLLPASVTRVTQQENGCVTPEPAGLTSEINDISEASRMSRMSRTNNSDTGKDEAITEYLDERAAIQEYDGKLDREQAEAEARRALRVFQYRLSDNPDAWLTLIAPGADLEQTRRDLRARYASRLLDVRPRLIKGD